MANQPQFRLREASVFSRQVKTRMPFRFGKATLTQMPILHLRLRLETPEGTLVTGASACGIPPLWFDKAAGKTHADNIQDLSVSLRLALDEYMKLDPAPVWFLHKVAEPPTRKTAEAKGLNGLTAGFGIALIDAALIDGACRHAGISFHAALKSNLLGYGNDFAALVPARPLERIALRHTVGLADPILDGDIADPVNDGLPESLEQVVRHYRARFFKIKISGDAAASRERLRRIASVLDAQAGDYRATLDGNEQFRDMAEFAAFIADAKADPALRGLWERTLLIEQPVGRSHSLVEAVAEPLREISAFKPVIIDESDGDDEAVEKALALGYQGISAKNCKGVFRTLHSFRAIKAAEAAGALTPILSSEDLTNVPTLPLQQDLCVAAALGIRHSERNGHHYIVGFDFLSPRERADALGEFPSLYAARGAGSPVVRIENGMIDAADLNRRGFGAASEPDWDFLEPVKLPGIPADLIGEGAQEGRSAP
jgi:hypothetical protein